MATQLTNKSLYVGDLAETVTEKTLTEFFKDFTIISMRLIHFTPSNSFPRTYAFVNFNTHDEAEKALSLAYTPINGKPCRIDWLNRDAASSRRQGIGNVFVKNLRQDVDPKKLAHAFGVFGSISSCKVVTDQNGHSKGYGFVQFKSEEEARKAILATQDSNEFLRVYGKDVSNRNEDDIRKSIQGIVGSLKVHDRPLIVNKFIPRVQRIQEMANTWTNLFVKNIDASVTQEEFKALCGQYGTVRSCKLGNAPHDRKTTFGFANYDTHEAAVGARNALNGISFKGSILEATQHKSKTERQRELEKNRRSLTNLYIKNLDDKIDEEILRQEFSDRTFSPIKSLKIERDEKRNSKGFGYVNLTTPEGALAAIAQMHHKPLIVNGVVTKPIYVALHEPKDIRKRRIQQYMNRPPHQLYYHEYVPGYAQPPPAVMPPRYPAYRPTPYSPSPLPVALPPSRPARQPPNGRGSQPPKQRPPQARPFDHQHVPTPLTVDIVQQYYPDQQRILLGERLYPLIARTQPAYAGKITGMLLNSGWKIEDLLNLLTNEEKLNTSINEAVNLLQKEQARQAQPQGPPQQQPQAPLPVSGKMMSGPLPDIRNYPVEQQKTMVTEQLARLVSTLMPNIPVNDVVKTLVTSYSLDDLFALMDDQVKLRRAVDEVMKK